MSKSTLYAANTASQAVVATGSVINFGSVVRKYGCNAYLSGGNAVVKGCGYYDIDVNLSLTSTGAGTAVVQLYKDGTVIPGATATLTTIADTSYPVTIPVVIREVCNCEATITAQITGAVGNIVNAAIEVIKL